MYTCTAGVYSFKDRDSRSRLYPATPSDTGISGRAYIIVQVYTCQFLAALGALGGALLQVVLHFVHREPLRAQLAYAIMIEDHKLHIL